MIKLLQETIDGGAILILTPRIYRPFAYQIANKGDLWTCYFCGCGDDFKHDDECPLNPRNKTS